MDKYTPGPWKLSKWVNVVDSKNETVQIVGVALPGRDNEEATANRNLFFASPDLLQALSNLLAMCERQEDFNDDGDGRMFERCYAAINKAKGSSNG